VAQLEAQAICNRQVVGSSPTTGSRIMDNKNPNNTSHPWTDGRPKPLHWEGGIVDKPGSGILKEFRAFILRGNVIDLAVAIAVGAAFTVVVQSMVAAFITPMIAAVFGKQDFGKMYFTIHDSRFAYGLFVNALVSFVITATVVFFFVVKPTQHLLTRFGMAPEAPPEKAACPRCHTEIPMEATRCAACTSELGSDWATPTLET